MRFALPVAIAVALVGTTQAQVYRCDGPEGPIFSQIPCAPDAATVPLQPSTGTPHPVEVAPTPGLERGFELLRQDELDRVARRGYVQVGMSPRQVRMAWGAPDRTSRTVGAGGNTEQWVYDRGRSRNQYVHFRDGIVSSISG